MPEKRSSRRRQEAPRDRHAGASDRVAARRRGRLDWVCAGWVARNEGARRGGWRGSERANRSRDAPPWSPTRSCRRARGQAVARDGSYAIVVTSRGVRGRSESFQGGSPLEQLRAHGTRFQLSTFLASKKVSVRFSFLSFPFFFPAVAFARLEPLCGIVARTRVFCPPRHWECFRGIPDWRGCRLVKLAMETSRNPIPFVKRALRIQTETDMMMRKNGDAASRDHAACFPLRQVSRGSLALGVVSMEQPVGATLQCEDRPT